MRITEQTRKKTVLPSSDGHQVGLDSLALVTLNERNQGLWDEALAANGGDPAWRTRKAAEARDLLALSQIAPPGRFQVVGIDLAVCLRALLWLRVPTPCRPDEHNNLQVADHALLGLTYPQEAIRLPMPGTAFIQILEPPNLWLPNVGSEGQPLCLGPQLPCGIPVKELVLMAYGALSMQSVQIDERDSAGVLNLDAAIWWQANTNSIPLSHTPFLRPE
jgi:hypothetical protein